MSNYPDLWRGYTFPSSLKDMDRFIDEWVGRRDPSGKQALAPKCEVSESKNQYLFKVEMPGIPKDQIKIEFHDQVLTISGEKKEEKYEDSAKCHLSELTYGSFMRSFNIPGPIHSEGIQATYDHGMLNVSVPKSEITKSKQIQIR